MENKDIKLEYYVLNYDNAKRQVVPYNIFNNCSVKKETLEALKLYTQEGENLQRTGLYGGVVYGFEAFCEELRSIIHWQQCGRREYEISVGDAFEEDISKYKKIDCYYQCIPNIQMIAREVVHQYKSQL